MNKLVKFLKKRNDRERKLIAVTGVILILAIFYFSALSPLFNSISEKNKMIERTHAQILKLQKITSGQDVKPQNYQHDFKELKKSESRYFQDLSAYEWLEKVKSTLPEDGLEVAVVKVVRNNSGYVYPVIMTQIELNVRLELVELFRFVNTLEAEYENLLITHLSYRQESTDTGRGNIKIHWLSTPSLSEERQ